VICVFIFPTSTAQISSEPRFSSPYKNTSPSRVRVFLSLPILTETSPPIDIFQNRREEETLENFLSQLGSENFLFSSPLPIQFLSCSLSSFIDSLSDPSFLLRLCSPESWSPSREITIATTTATTFSLLAHPTALGCRSPEIALNRSPLSKSRRRSRYCLYALMILVKVCFEF